MSALCHPDCSFCDLEEMSDAENSHSCTVTLRSSQVTVVTSVVRIKRDREAESTKVVHIIPGSLSIGKLQPFGSSWLKPVRFDRERESAKNLGFARGPLDSWKTAQVRKAAK
eukprot:1183218-Amphidinium_carterae.1